MSRDQVVAHTDFGPYKTFRNGDVETFNGIFDGRKENVQFFFDDSGLRRIGVYLYEGTDLVAAASKWKKCYETLVRLYGPIETFGLRAATSDQPSDLEAMALDVIATVGAGTKVQLAPKRQPDNLYVFSSIWRVTDEGINHFYVTVYLDPPRL